MGKTIFGMKCVKLFEAMLENVTMDFPKPL
jgi:hypothetical protein